MNLNQLNYLIDIEETHSLSLSSERLFISQQALSQAIKTLSNEYGISILEKTPHGVFFTEDGQKLLDFAHQTVNAHRIFCQKINYNVNPNQQELSGNLQLIAQSGFFPLFLTEATIAFRNQFPNVKISSLHQQSDILKDLLSHPDKTSSTIIFSEYIDVPNDSDNSLQHLPNTQYHFIPIFKTSLFLIVSASSSLAKRTSVSLDSLISKNTYSFALLTDYLLPGTSPLEQYFIKSHKANIVLRTNNTRIWVDAIMSGDVLGLLIGELYNAFLPISQYQNVLAFIPLKLSFSLPSYLGYFVPENPSPSVTAFLELLTALPSFKNLYTETK